MHNPPAEEPPEDSPVAQPGPSSSRSSARPPAHDLARALEALHHEVNRLEELARRDLGSIPGDARLQMQRVVRGEHRLSVAAVVLLAIVLELLLPAHLLFKPVWTLPALESALLVGLVAANPTRIERTSRLLRAASLVLIATISLANAWSAALLVRSLVTRHEHLSAAALLGSGAAIYGTNILVFGLWYWEFDRGGPVARFQGHSRVPDFLFPQYTNPEFAPPDWRPSLFDYLYTSFTNASAFSPTDVMPLSRWSKGLFLVQSAVSLTTVALVVARAVNILA